jgi:transcriptional regulator with XRE-family HTH domain
MKEKARAELKERLHTAMKLKGIRAVDLVEQTGVPKGAISYYLAGRSQPKADRLHVLAKALDVSEAWLLGYDVPMARTAEQKKNDDLVAVIAKLRKDPDFFEVVSILASLKPAEYASIKQILSALGDK